MPSNAIGSAVGASGTRSNTALAPERIIKVASGDLNPTRRAVTV
jgi:hypothetical protein